MPHLTSAEKTCLTCFGLVRGWIALLIRAMPPRGGGEGTKVPLNEGNELRIDTTAGPAVPELKRQSSDVRLGILIGKLVTFFVSRFIRNAFPYAADELEEIMDKEHTATPTIDLSGFRRASPAQTPAPLSRVNSLERTGSELSSFLEELDAELAVSGSLSTGGLASMERVGSDLSAVSLRCALAHPGVPRWCCYTVSHWVTRHCSADAFRCCSLTFFYH